MIVEVIAVGTELLIGQIVNSNAAWIGARLADEGFDANHQVTVGDNLDRLADTIRTAIGRADAVILTGGIGPTQDDLTREAICAVTGREMVRDDEYAEAIRQRILARRGHIADNVLRMADHPEGADTLPNSQGVALGIALDHDGTLIFATPGVPREMKAIMDEHILPRLRAAAGVPTTIRSRMLRTWGHGESQIAEWLGDLYETTNPSVAFLISDMEVKVRITAKAEDAAAAEALIAPVEAEVRSRLGDAVFASDDETVLDVLVAACERRGWSIGVGEAGTEGAVGATFAAARLGPLVGALTLPSGSADELVERASSVFGADVVLGVSEPRIEEDSGSVATILDFRIDTPEGTNTRTMRFFGTGERATSYAAIAATHLLRLAVSGGAVADSA